MLTPHPRGFQDLHPVGDEPALWGGAVVQVASAGHFMARQPIDLQRPEGYRQPSTVVTVPLAWALPAPVSKTPASLVETMCPGG